MNAWRALVLLSAGLVVAVRGTESALTLDDAVALALRQSKGAQLAQLKVDEAAASATAARLLRYPRVNAVGMTGYYFRPLDVTLRQGALTPLLDTAGNALGFGPLSSVLGPFPSNDLSLARGDRFQSIGGLTVVQPLSQQWRIGSGVQAARAARTAAEREAARTAAQIRLAVEELFAGILLEEQRRTERVARVAFAERRLRDAENAHSVGELLDDAVLALRAAAIEARSDLARSDQQRARLTLQLADLIGKPGVESLALHPALPERAPHPVEYWLAKVALNPDRQIAEATAEQARAGARAARQARIPELSAFASGYAQEGLPLLPTRGGSVGLALQWDIFDFGRRRADVARTIARQRAAEVNRDRLEEDAARQVRIAYQDFTHAGELVTLAMQAAAYRGRTAGLARASAATGLQLEATALGAEADLRKAEADLAAARTQRHLALLRLYFLVGD